MEKDSSFSVAYSTFLNDIIGLIRVLSRQDDLQQLFQWAKRKRLSRPQKLYQSRLHDEEIRLNRYLVRYPTMTVWAGRIHGLWRSLAPKTHYYRHGYAAKYRIYSR